MRQGTGIPFLLKEYFMSKIVKITQSRDGFIRSMANRYANAYCNDMVEGEIKREVDIFNLNTGNTVRHTEIYDRIINS